MDSTVSLAMLDFSKMVRPANSALKEKETLKITRRLSALQIVMPPAVFAAQLQSEPPILASLALQDTT